MTMPRDPSKQQPDPSKQQPDPSKQPHDDEDVDGCEIDFAKAEQTSDEDLPVAFGGEA
jgi:hypothetical protein